MVAYVDVVSNDRPKTCEVVKRDGRKESFDKKKIVRAIKRCLLALHRPEDEAEYVGVQIAHAVANIIFKARYHEINIEDIQRLVIQQLWANNHFEAAESYTLYRDKRRAEREQHPVSPEVAKAIEEDRAHFPTDLQYYQFVSKFARWNAAAGRRETWREACDRVMSWFKRQKQIRLTDAEWAELSDSLYNMQATCSLRVIQMAGPALDRCNVGVYNCAYHPISDIFSFPELLYILMQGTGSGFSVESDYIDKLPKVKKQRTGKRALPKKKIKVEDSTEGWCEAYRVGLETWWDGGDVEFDTSGVRPEGAALKTKGGRASGPGPLLELLNFARSTILKNQGGYLNDIDVHDLCCMTGRIVQVGGVRRASCISLSDLYSTAMRNAKSGNWYDKARWRTMANNSAVYEERPDAIEFMEEWLALAQSGSGERGIFNRSAVLKQLPARRKKVRFGCNPCAEIVLRPYEFCNLSIAIARPDDTVDSLIRKVRIATIFGTMQATYTNFNYIRPDWKFNCEDERLIGVDITGHADCPLLRHDNPDRAKLLQRLKHEVAETNSKYAERFGINRSAADTCVKPSGDSSILFDCSSGVSPRFDKYQIRWVRESNNSPIAAFLKAEGVEWAQAPEDPSLCVFAFPKAAPEGSVLRNDLTAIQQLENWLEWKKNWAEHSISCTIYVEPHEWFEVGNWVYEHFDEISGVSFLPKDNGNYKYAPNESLSKEEFESRIAKFPKLNWSKLRRYEVEDMTTISQQLACTGDTCSLA